MSRVTTADIERAIAARFPTEWAEDWDRVGLLAGDPEREVTGVVLALDPTRAGHRARGRRSTRTSSSPIIRRSSRRPTGSRPAEVPRECSSRRWMRASRSSTPTPTSIALRPRDACCPMRSGLEPIKPIERSTMPMALITVFVPPDHAEKVAQAMSGAGAGRIGEYEGCRFISAEGVGSFTPARRRHRTRARRAGAPTPRRCVLRWWLRARVLVVWSPPRAELTRTRSRSSLLPMSRSHARAPVWACCNRAPDGLTLGALATVAAGTFNITPRIWGDPDMTLTRVATATGSASSLVGDVLASNASALVAGEVRYHDALDALEMGLAIVELGHDVSEWPLVSLLEEAVRSVPGLDPQTVHVMPATPGWWTP